MIISVGPKWDLEKSLFIEIFSSSEKHLSSYTNNLFYYCQSAVTINRVKSLTLRIEFNIFGIDKHPLSSEKIRALKVIKMYLSLCCLTEIEC